MLRFGICGCGRFMEAAVIPIMQRLENASVEAVFGSNTETLERVSSKFGISKICQSYEEMLEDPNIDVIYIASPNVFHKKQSIDASNAGKHVFCQKPLAMNTSDCREMITAAKENDRRLGVGFCYRFGGAQQLAKRLIKEGQIGNVTYTHLSFNAPNFTSVPGWRLDSKISGGGPLMDIAPHLIDMAQYLTGQQATSVMAYVQPKKTENAIEIDAAALFDCGNSRVAIDTSFTRCNLHNYTVIGDKGQIEAIATMSWMAGGILKLQQEGKETILDFPQHEHIEEEMRQYCQAIESGNEVPVPGEAGLYAQAVIDAIYESGKTGKRVQIEA